MDVYPDCERFHEIAESCSKHGKNLIENLGAIKAGKVEEWLEEEDRRWRCPKCGKPIIMHLTECHWCGAELNTK